MPGPEMLPNTLGAEDRLDPTWLWDQDGIPPHPRLLSLEPRKYTTESWDFTNFISRFFCLFFFLDHAGHMSVLGSAMVCQPEIHKANLTTSQSPSKPFMSQGRLCGSTSLWPFGPNFTPSPWTQRPSRVLPGWDASAKLVVTLLVWQLAREPGAYSIAAGFTLAQCCE